MKERVKFYSENDWCYGWHLDKIETIEIPNINDVTINDAIEFFEINRYFENGVRSKLWNDAQVIEYTEKSQKLNSLCRQFFNQIDNENIIGLYNDIELGYNSTFWHLFDDCKLFDRISNDVFSSLIEQEHISPHDLLRHRNIVKKYGKLLCEYLLRNDFCVPVILRIYEQDFTGDEKLFLPEELTGQDICNYLESYIDGMHPNANYLSEIENMRYTKRFPITDEIRLKAKRRYEDEVKKIFETGARMEYGYQISFNPEQKEEKAAKDCTIDGVKSFCLSYSTKWLEDTLDFPSILNNFIYIFEFVDFSQMRSMHVSKKEQNGVFDDILSSKSSRCYHSNTVFKAKQNFAIMQMTAYYEFLERYNIQLEDVLRWFFTEYLQNEFSCPEIRVSFPSKGSSFSEKCSTIITAFETVIKQYVLFVKHGSIDFDLVAMSTTPILFKDIGSLIDNKYVYGTGSDYINLTNMLFSRQNLLLYANRICDEGHYYDSLFELLLNELLYLSDYKYDKRKSFEYLERFDIVNICEDGKIELKNKIKIAILRDLHMNDVISKQHYPLDAQKDIDDFILKGVLRDESTLFSKPEVDYLNYVLNRSEFVNGLEIRNKYIHGIQQVNTNEEEHKQNYYKLLMLFVLLAIKINDEFCLKDMIERSKDK